MKLKFMLWLFLVSLLASSVYGLAVGGKNLIVYIDHPMTDPISYNYYFVNNDGYNADYELFTENAEGSENLATNFRIYPKEFENVISGESRQFTITVDLPDKIDSPGQNEVRVFVRGTTKLSGNLIAKPVVGIRFFIFVLYPWKFLKWDYNVPNINVNESKNITVTFENLGEPIINSAYANIDIYDSNHQLHRSLRTRTAFYIKPKDKITTYTVLDTNGLLSGEYQAIGTVYWDENVSTKDYNFTIGQKLVNVENFTNLFEYNAINRFDILVKSEWNDPVNKIVAYIDIYDKTGQTKLTSFKSFENNLGRLQKKSLEAYFDTTGLKKDEYLARIKLSYDGQSSNAEGFIRIDENINAVVVDEIPGKFKISNYLPKEFTMIHFLSLLLLIFIIINIYLLYRTIYKKDKPIDTEVLEYVKDLKKKYNDEYIIKVMTKKGWSNEKISEMLKKIK